MLSWSKSDDRVAIGLMNDELRHAQLDLLSAECSTGRLRLKFSAEDIAAYGDQNVLRKAIASVRALHDYYVTLTQRISVATSNSAQNGSAKVSEHNVATVAASVRQYIRHQRDEHRPNGLPLTPGQSQVMNPFFSSSLLAAVRVVQMRGYHLNSPPFYEQAKALGFTNLPDFSYMTSLTFDDVLVFPGEIGDRRLFHALVHAAQFRILGLDRYAELFAGALLRNHAQVSLPFNVQAFSLEARFAENPKISFSVEEAVTLWATEGRF